MTKPVLNSKIETKKMATNTNLLLKEVKDITECPICTEHVQQPEDVALFSYVLSGMHRTIWQGQGRG